MKPRVLVSLLVGHASEQANLIPAVSTLATLVNSDLCDHVDARVVTLINGMGVGRFVARSEALLSQFGAVIVEPRNLGIAKGRNRILREVQAWGERPDYVLEIHNDMIFPEAWFWVLQEEMVLFPTLGAIGPGLLTSGGFFGGPKLTLNLQRQDVGDLQRTVGVAAKRAYEEYGRLVPRRRRGISHPLLTRYAAMETIGVPAYYDEQFSPQNWEDTDVVRRLEAAGWDVRVSLDTWVYHQYHMSRLQMGVGESYRQNLVRFHQKYKDAAAWITQWDADLERMYR